MNKYSIILLGFFLFSTILSQNKGTKIVLKSDVKWEQLNPKRGNKSPLAGTLWGNRNEKISTGFLLKPINGFKSPLHIHNVLYRGIVINGLIHNDDPKAANMWMPAGSFWTQPEGEIHITAAKGENVLAYIEIDEGPYLVYPPDESYHTDEKPVNIDKNNIVWVDASDISWIKIQQTGKKSEIEIAYLWGKNSENILNGTLIKIPPHRTIKISKKYSSIHMVNIKGEFFYGKTEEKKITPGSYIGSEGNSEHIIKNLEQETVIYIRTIGKYSIEKV